MKLAKLPITKERKGGREEVEGGREGEEGGREVLHPLTLTDH